MLALFLIVWIFRTDKIKYVLKYISTPKFLSVGIVYTPKYGGGGNLSSTFI